MTTIYITPCESGPHAWRGNHHALVQLADIADPKMHEIVADPERADTILITDLREADYFNSLRRHPLLGAYPHKCYGYSELDWPARLLRGVYPGMRRSLFNMNRFRASSYLMRYSEWRNQFISTTAAIKRDLLFSFMGRNSSAVRARLFNSRFNRSDIVIEDTSSFENWTSGNPARIEAQRRYADTIARSKFVLCPAGAGPGTIRVFEAMEMGAVPVMLSDRWLRPRGPDWPTFAVFVPENRIEELPEIVQRYENDSASMGQLARKNWEEWFAPSKQFNFIVSSLESIKRTSWLSERAIVRWAWPLMVLQKKYVTPRRWFFGLCNQIRQNLPIMATRLPRTR